MTAEKASGRSEALARAAEAMLRAVGGGEVILRMPVAADATDQGLGLEMASPQEIAVSPVVVRTMPGTSDSTELLFSARTLAPLGGDASGLTAKGFLEGVLSFELADGRQMVPSKVTAELFAGAEYLLRVQVTERSASQG